MQPVVAKFRTFREAEAATRDYYRRLSHTERLEILFQLRGMAARRAMPLPEGWRAFIESLNSHGVECVVVDAVALAHHEISRYTGDLDLLVHNSAKNAQRLESALADFGFAALGLKAADFADSCRGVQLGVPPNRVDLLTSITGVTSDEAWAGRVEAVVGETRVNFIGRDALIRNKRLTGRPQDKADLEALGASEKS
jgi:glycine cleavage system aminomethyltransferase T